jgi:hypothetical protein
VAQVPLLRPEFLVSSGSWPERPGLKIETWATHSMAASESSFSAERSEIVSLEAKVNFGLSAAKCEMLVCTGKFIFGERGEVSG